MCCQRYLGVPRGDSPDPSPFLQRHLGMISHRYAMRKTERLFSIFQHKPNFFLMSQIFNDFSKKSKLSCLHDNNTLSSNQLLHHLQKLDYCMMIYFTKNCCCNAHIFGFFVMTWKIFIQNTI